MAQKTRKLAAVTRIDYNGKAFYEGSPDGATFDCDIKEAARLVGLGVAREVTVAIAAAGPSAEELAEQAKKELLEKIAAAATPDDLRSLMPEETPEEDIVAAFAARMKELQPE